MKRQRHLHVLNRILVKREHFITIRNHLLGGTAAAEVQNLIPLIDRAAGLNCNGAAAGDESPCIQARTALHCYGTAGLHFYEAVRADNFALRTAGSRIVLSADTDCRSAFKRDRAAFCHGQRPERLGIRLGGSRCWGISIAGLSLIKRNQQSNTRRNSIVAAYSTVADERNLRKLVCLSKFNCAIKIREHFHSGFKNRRFSRNKLRNNAAFFINMQGSLSRCGYILSGRLIIPADKFISCVRSGFKFIFII